MGTFRINPEQVPFEGEGELSVETDGPRQSPSADPLTAPDVEEPPVATGRTQTSPSREVFSGDLVMHAINRGRPRPGEKAIFNSKPNTVGGDLVAAAIKSSQTRTINEEIRDFSSGLITDASPLIEIAHGSRDEQNMLIVEDGSRARRLGLNYEDTFVRRAVTGGGVNLRPLLWMAGSNGEASVVSVVPTAGTYTTSSAQLEIFDLDASDIATRNVSNNFAGTLALTETNVYNLTQRITPAAWGNELYIPLGYGSNSIQMAALTSDSGGRTLTTRPLRIRDHWGIDDSLAVTERPSSLTAAHLYNLVNQGWSYAQASAFFGVLGKWPSNADVVYNGVDTANNYIAARLGDRPFPTGAPRGSVVLDMTDFDRTVDQKVIDEFAAASLSTASLTKDEQGIELMHMTEFAGRLFFAFTRSTAYGGGNNAVPDMEHFLLFSKSITHGVIDSDAVSPSQAVHQTRTAIDCYSEFDPTQPDFELSDADGGFYALPEVGKVKGMGTIGGTLYVIANNGVWSLSSANGIFEPTAAFIEKVTNIGCVAEESVLTAENRIFYLGQDGMYSLLNQGPGQSAIQRVSRNKVDTWWRTRIANVRDSVYDPALNEVHWLIQKPHDAGDTGWQETGSELKQEEIIFNLVTNSWTKNRFPNVTLTVSGTANVATTITSGTYINGYVQLPGPLVSDMPERNDGSDTAADITRHTPVDIRRSTMGIKYMVQDSTGYTFADMSIRSQTYAYTDFTDGANEEVDGYLVGLSDNDLDSQRPRQVGLITVHFYRTELGTKSDGGGGWEAKNQGSCLLTYYWDTEQITATERTARQREIYRLVRSYTITPGGTDPYDYGQAVISTKNKIRGRGRTLQLEYRTSSTKDLQILGWGITKRIGRRP
jgi:hypothetical protein